MERAAFYGFACPKIAMGNSEPLNGGYTSAPLESVNWKEEQEKRPKIYGKTLQDKLGELPVERQDKIKKLAAQKKSKTSKIESIERMAEEADRAGLYDKVLVPDSEISIQILDSVSADLPTVLASNFSPIFDGPFKKVFDDHRMDDEPQNLTYEPFED